MAKESAMVQIETIFNRSYCIYITFHPSYRLLMAQENSVC